MKTLTHKCLEETSLYLDLSESLLNEMDIFLSNSDLTDKQQKTLVKLFQAVYSESYVNSLTE